MPVRVGRSKKTRSVREWADGSRAPGADVVHRLRTSFYVAGILSERESAKVARAWFPGVTASSSWNRRASCRVLTWERLAMDARK